MDTEALYKRAYMLAILTIIGSTLEGSFSVFFGYQSASLTLFGNGVVSYIEVISGIGIIGMIIRMRKPSGDEPKNFERMALRITGYGLYFLTAGLAFMSIYNAINNYHPKTTLSGIIIAIITIIGIGALALAKKKVGKKLNSQALLADAECTLICVYMSTAVFISSVIYELTKFEFADAMGAIVLAYFAYKEARECFKF